MVRRILLGLALVAPIVTRIRSAQAADDYDALIKKIDAAMIRRNFKSALIILEPMIDRFKTAEVYHKSAICYIFSDQVEKADDVLGTALSSKVKLTPDALVEKHLVEVLVKARKELRMAQTKAEDALNKATAANELSHKAMDKAQETEVKFTSVEARSRSAETKSTDAEAKATKADTRARSAENRAEAAEERASKAEAVAKECREGLKISQEKLAELQKSVEQMTKKLDELSKK